MSKSAPVYRLRIRADTGTVGPGATVAELQDVKNIGYADYMNGVPEMFFTLMTDDPKVPVLRPLEGRAHAYLYRNDEIVWAGWLMDHSATATDTVFYCYGYAAAFFWLCTDWNQEFEDMTIAQIVEALWNRASSRDGQLTLSQIGFVSTGTIEAPPTETGGSTPITLENYTAFYKRILFVLQEMAALGASDTLNTTLFEITHSETPVFNFWKNRGQDRPAVRWSWGDSIIQDFSDEKMPVDRRNDLLGVGATPKQAVLRKRLDHMVDTEEWGRRQEPLFFSWVRDEEELNRVMLIRSRLARQNHTDLSLTFFPNAVEPPSASSSWRIADRAAVDIELGATSLSGWFIIIGYQVLVLGGEEHLRAHLRSMYQVDADLFSLDADRLLDDEHEMDSAA